MEARGRLTVLLVGVVLAVVAVAVLMLRVLMSLVALRVMLLMEFEMLQTAHVEVRNWIRY